MALNLRYDPLAQADLLGLAGYIGDRNSPAVARAYLQRIESLCAGLNVLPERGVSRTDLGPGVRIVAMERRVQVVYRVAPDTVTILRVLYGGRELGADDLPN